MKEMMILASAILSAAAFGACAHVAAPPAPVESSIEASASELGGNGQKREANSRQRLREFVIIRGDRFQ